MDKDNTGKKILIFVSTGRCGTRRIYEILENNLPSDRFNIFHQISVSRAANIAGNLLLTLPFKETFKEKIKERLFSNVLRNCSAKNLISSDPLISLIIPKCYVESSDLKIVHIYRDTEGTAGSFFRLTRLKIYSFIAHNFIPFWQPKLLPLENLLSPNIISKYKKIVEYKNKTINQLYSDNPGYMMVEKDILFSKQMIESIIELFFEIEVDIREEELDIYSNYTKRMTA